MCRGTTGLSPHTITFGSFVSISSSCGFQRLLLNTEKKTYSSSSTRRRRELLNISDWSFDRVGGEIRRQYIEATGKVVSMYDFEISANRERHDYVWKIIVPLCLIVFMSWADPIPISARLRDNDLGCIPALIQALVPGLSAERFASCTSLTRKRDRCPRRTSRKRDVVLSSSI